MAGGGDSQHRFPVQRSEEEWRRILTAEQYRVLRKGGTECPFLGAYGWNKKEGRYSCVGCGAIVFASSAKFQSWTGWPSFFESAAAGAVIRRKERFSLLGAEEVLCARCGSHLGHVFRDGPRPSGLRFCINSVALHFKPGENLK